MVSTLVDVREGERAVVTGVGNSRLAPRILGVGIAPGVKVLVTRKVPRHGVVVRLDGSKVFLEERVARLIMVRPE